MENKEILLAGISKLVKAVQSVQLNVSPAILEGKYCPETKGYEVLLMWYKTDDQPALCHAVLAKPLERGYGVKFDPPHPLTDDLEQLVEEQALKIMVGLGESINFDE